MSYILCGFRKAHSTQQALFRLLQSWQKELDNAECVGAILKDLPKTYDCIPHDLLIAKWEEYRLDKTASSFSLAYLSRIGRVIKIGPVYSTWVKMLSGIPQGFVSGPLLFNIFTNDWFFFVFKSEICSFADDNTLHSCGQVLENILCNFKYDLHNLLKN